MNRTICSLAVAALLGQRRFWMLIGLPLLVAVIVLIPALMGSGADTSWSLLEATWLPLMVPMLALIAASGVLGPELDDGSIVYLLAKPISRHTVIRSKYAVAATATLLLSTLPVLATGLVIEPGAPDHALALALGSGVAAVVYVALFLAFTVRLRHSVAAAILYVFVWEQTLGGLLSGAAKFSVTGWGQRIAASVSSAVSEPDLALWWAWAASALVLAGGLWWAGDRLRSYSARNDDQ